MLGENIAQSGGQFVETGAADIGIIAHSLAKAPALRDKGRYWPSTIRLSPDRAGRCDCFCGLRNELLRNSFRSFFKVRSQPYDFAGLRVHLANKGMSIVAARKWDATQRG